MVPLGLSRRILASFKTGKGQIKPRASITLSISQHCRARMEKSTVFEICFNGVVIIDQVTPPESLDKRGYV